MIAAAVPARAPRTASALRPGRAELVDALMLVALTVIGIVGFRTAYGGHDYLVAGALGAVLGVLLSHVGYHVKLPLLAIAAVNVLVFLLLAGAVAQPGAVAKIPTLATTHAVITASIHGWKQLLTTARPVGTAAHLLVLPFLLGLAAGVVGHALARRTTRVLLPAAAPAAVVALSILFGAGYATAAVLQGAAFAGLALAWAAIRHQRGGQLLTVGRQRAWQRLGAALAVLAVAVAGATVIGPRLPGAQAHQRVVLHAVPPFNVDAYPSPLAGFRAFTKGAAPSVSVYAKRLLTTAGLPPGSRVRIATMDSYNDLVWGVANAAAGTSSFAGFQRVGGTLPGAGGGATHTATITIDGAYQLPWLPDLAGTTGFTFAGATGRAVGSTLWFNVATATGLVPGGLPAGLRYTVTAARVPVPTQAQLSNATPYGAPDTASGIPAAVQSFASAHAASAGSPMQKVLYLAAYLKRYGRYSNGGTGQANIPAGHSAGRLTTFLQSAQIIGDDEQYAATMALLADAVGVPAAVALDGTVEPDGGVYGRDVHADVELHLAQYGWVTLPASQFVGTGQATPQPQTVKRPAPAKYVPPPVSNPAPATSENENNAASRNAPSQPGHGPFHIPAIVIALLKDVGLPLLLVAAIAAALTGTKRLRRRRRRSRGPAAARATGAWRELLDLGRDLGVAPVAAATRREHATHAERHGLAHVTPVAAAADAAVFGPADPDDATVAHIWNLAEESRRATTASLARWRRAWVAVNPASLWASRGDRPRPPRAGRAAGRPAPARPRPRIQGLRP
jgi:transglutaminase superfamily protein